MKNEIQITESSQDVIRGPSNPMISNGTLLKVEEVARILRLKPETVRAMARRGDLPAIKLGRVWRFRRSSISELLED
ncbi:MAG: helix-turn-helix domain-containing protein [Chloroflexota bacterium]|nr:MAG: helix-turn-helix domain-containing protein [Chloroflexota bacterium]